MATKIVSARTAFIRLTGPEGGWVKHPSDPGGETIYGITRRDHPDLWVNGKPPTLEQAMERAIRDYWTPISGDAILAINGEVAYEVFEQQYNSGLGAKHLQRALNVLNRRARDYPELVVDGGIGPKTISALRAFFTRWDAQAEKLILRTLDGYQFMHYAKISENNDQFEDFMCGWVLKRIGE